MCFSRARDSTSRPDAAAGHRVVKVRPGKRQIECARIDSHHLASTRINSHQLASQSSAALPESGADRRTSARRRRRRLPDTYRDSFEMLV